MNDLEATDDAQFASGPLVALVAAAFQAEAPELLPADLRVPDRIREARGSMALKRELLELGLRARGPAFVFGIADHMRSFASHPVLQAFLRSAEPEVLLRKWARFERYGHALHRTRFVERGPANWELEHYARRGPQPGASHDVFILGIFRALLEGIGTEGLHVAMQPRGPVLVENGEVQDLEGVRLPSDTSRWSLQWRSKELAESRPVRLQGGFSGAIREMLALDPARSWRLAELAPRLGQSARSLQRRLAGEGTSFSQIVRAVRVSEACRLLETTGYSSTEIGYLCGFSDAAHFARDFRATVGATPSDFRKVVEP